MGCICISNVDNNDINDETSDENKQKLYRSESLVTVDYNSNYPTDSVNLRRNISQYNNLHLDKLINDMYNEYNKIRSDPSSYISIIETNYRLIRKKTESSFYLSLDDKHKILIKGNLPGLFKELIEYLSNRSPLRPFERDEILMVTAKKGLDIIDMDKDKRIDDLRKILENYDYDDGREVNRIIGYGDLDPRVIILLQLIDNRDNYNSRNAIFSEKYRNIGIVGTFHSSYRLVTVTDLSN